MIGPEYGPVIGKSLPESGKGCYELGKINLPQNLLSEVGGNGLHLGGYCGIFRCEVRMVTLCVHYHEAVAVILEVDVDRGEYRILIVRKVYSHDSALGTSDLVHEA